MYSILVSNVVHCYSSVIYILFTDLLKLAPSAGSAMMKLGQCMFRGNVTNNLFSGNLAMFQRLKP